MPLSAQMSVVGEGQNIFVRDSPPHTCAYLWAPLLYQFSVINSQPPPGARLPRVCFQGSARAWHGKLARDTTSYSLAGKPVNTFIGLNRQSKAPDTKRRSERGA